MNYENEIFGYTWSEIQRAQQGGQLHKTVSGPVKKPELNTGDMDLLNKHGIDGLEKLQLFGVIDRLKQTGTI
jgi:hypothetical protein